VEIWELRDGSAERKTGLEHWCDFSPDSKFVAGARPDGSVGIYEAASGKEIKRIAEGMDVSGLVYHPDGRQLTVLLKSDRHVVAFLDLETGKEVGRCEQSAAPAVGPTWRRDGRLLAFPRDDQRIYVWDPVRKHLQSVLEGHTGLGIDVKFTYGGDFLVSRSWDGSTRFWDPISGRQTLREPETFFVAISGDDRQVVVLKDGDLVLREFAGGWECRTLHHGQVGNQTERPINWGPNGLDFSPDGRLLVSTSSDGVRLWDLETFAEIAYLPVKPAASALFHPDGNSLFTYGPPGMHRWPIRREMERTATTSMDAEILHIGPPQTLDVPGNSIYAGMSLDRLGTRLAGVDVSHGRALVLDLEHPGQQIVLQDRGIAGCFLSPDGHWAIATGHGRPGFKVYDISTGKPVPWAPPEDENFFCFTADGGWLVTRTSDQMHLHYWQIGTWQLGPPVASARKLVSPSVSPDSTVFLWTSSVNLPPKLVRVDTGKMLGTLEPSRDVGSAVWRFSPDGTNLAVATGNHTIHVWDLRELRRGLAKLGLDWDQPAFSPKVPSPARPIRGEVKTAESAP
jgi:WD40 repeat protein